MSDALALGDRSPGAASQVQSEAARAAATARRLQGSLVEPGRTTAAVNALR